MGGFEGAGGAGGTEGGDESLLVEVDEEGFGAGVFEVDVRSIRKSRTLAINFEVWKFGEEEAFEMIAKGFHLGEGGFVYEGDRFS